MYETGAKQWQANYEDNLKQGEFIEYHPTGELLRRGHYKNNVPDGVHRFLHPNTSEIGVASVENGNGTWSAWFS